MQGLQSPPVAMRLAAGLLRLGGHPVDAPSWYLKAAGAGDHASLLHVAALHREAGEFDTALARYTRAADRHERDACREAARMLRDVGGPEDALDRLRRRAVRETADLLGRQGDSPRHWRGTGAPPRTAAPTPPSTRPVSQSSWTPGRTARRGPDAPTVPTADRPRPGVFPAGAPAPGGPPDRRSALRIGRTPPYVRHQFVQQRDQMRAFVRREPADEIGLAAEHDVDGLLDERVARGGQ